MITIRFGGSVARTTVLLALALLLLALLVGPLWFRLGAAALGLWLLCILWGFRLDIDPAGITRRVGPLVLRLAWSEIAVSRIEPVPGFGRVRFVLRDRQGRRISFPLFLLSVAERDRLWAAMPHPSQPAGVGEKGRGRET